MNKFDIVEKIKLTDLLKAELIRKSVSPYQLLQNKLGLAGNWHDNYFNWGRNALYYLFKNLNYQKIAFPAFTCPTLTEAAEKAGKKVVLVEADLNTFNLDINKIPQGTQCLVVVHTFGNPLDISLIKQKFKSIFIIEDCAHALYAQKNNQYVGKTGEVILFSLYKQIPNINGSLLLTKEEIINNQQAENKFKYLKRLLFKLEGLHEYFLNLKRHAYFPDITRQDLNNFKPSNLVFNLFQIGFNPLEKEIEKRRIIANLYYRRIKKSTFLLAQNPEKQSNPSYYHFAVRLIPKLIPFRNKIIMNLRRQNIFLAALWPDAPITQAKYKNYQHCCPKAFLLAQSIINFPIYSYYSSKDINDLFTQIDLTIKKFIS